LLSYKSQLKAATAPEEGLCKIHKIKTELKGRSVPREVVHMKHSVH